MRMKGLDPNLVQAIAVGDPALRLQAAISGAVQAVSVRPPYDLMLEQKGLKSISGPPESACCRRGVLFAADRSIKENPQVLRWPNHSLATLKANRFIEGEPGRNDSHHDQVRAAVG